MSIPDFSQINSQLTLAMQCNDEANLTDFCWSGNELLQQQIIALLPRHLEQACYPERSEGAPASREILSSAYIESQNDESIARILYIWGSSGSGKTYLLQAICQEMAKQNHTVAYLPLKLLRDWDPAILEGMSDYHLVAVDDIEHIAGHKAWEEALFHLYNRLQAQNKNLIFTSQISPLCMPLQLADLRSRLTCAFIAQIHELNDEDKISTLQTRAKKCGLELPNSVGHYILNHCARNMHELHSILERLDHASLVAQRKLTIPFVKNVLSV